MAICGKFCRFSKAAPSSAPQGNYRQQGWLPGPGKGSVRVTHVHTGTRRPENVCKQRVQFSKPIRLINYDTEMWN